MTGASSSGSRSVRPSTTRDDVMLAWDVIRELAETCSLRPDEGVLR